MELKGRVHEIQDAVQVSETFQKRILVLEYAENPTYPEYIPFEFTQDKTALLDTISVGQEIEVSFNLRGRPYTDKAGKTSYFMNLQGWRLTALSAAPEYDGQDPAQEEEDLPF